MKVIKVKSLSKLKRVLAEMRDEEKSEGDITIREQNEDCEKCAHKEICERESKCIQDVVLLYNSLIKTINAESANKAEPQVVAATLLTLIYNVLNDENISSSTREMTAHALIVIANEALEEMEEEEDE